MKRICLNNIFIFLFFILYHSGLCQTLATDDTMELDRTLNKINILYNEGKYSEAFDLGFNTIKRIDIQKSKNASNLLLHTAELSLLEDFNVNPFIEFLYKNLHGKNEIIIYAFLENLIQKYSKNDFNILIEKDSNKFNRFLPYFTMYAANVSVKETNRSVMRLASNINVKNNVNDLLKSFDYLITDSLKTPEEIIATNERKDVQALLASILGMKYLNDNKIDKADRILSQYKDNLLVFSIITQIAENYFKQKSYNDVERIFQSFGQRLSYKSGLYLLVAEAQIHSYDLALKNFKTNYMTYAENTIKDKQFWELIARLYKEELGAMYVTELYSKFDETRSDYEKYCILNYFIGIKFLFEGNSSTAVKYFNEAVSTGKKELPEYQLASAELNNHLDINFFIDDEKKTIAVSNFEAYGFSKVEAKLVANKLTSLVTELNIFTVLERAKMQEILEEQGFQLSGCVSNECVVEAGQLLGVQLMLTGSIGRFGTLNIIDLRIIDIETGGIARSVSHESEGRKELIFTSGLNQALSKLFE